MPFLFRPRLMVGSLVRLVALASVAAAAITTVAPREAHAFCGFYVAPDGAPLTADASIVALMREGSRTVISMSSNYKGPAKDFAMVVPVPVVLHEEDVKTLPKEIFAELEAMSAPRLVEYWEQDPCRPTPSYDYSVNAPTPSVTMSDQEAVVTKSDADYGVKVAAKFSVGEYDVVVLDAKASDGLEAWLHDHKYKIPEGSADALAPYIKEQQKFFVAKVDVKKVQMDAQGVAVLSPLRFAYESADFRLPVRLGLLNAPTGQTSDQKQDLLVFLLSKDKRYEVANYPNVYAPTNVELTEAARAKFPSVYAAVFDAAVDRWGGKGIVTEYAWDSQWQPWQGGMSGGDPCTAPPVAPDYLSSLGGDVLFGGQITSMTLTRLHARYDKTTLTDDLVFRSAEPITGGFEGADYKQNPKSAQPSSTNAFQARYVIRHPWTGPVECEKPQRGIWGGPPNGYTGESGVAPAMNLAGASRKGIELRTYLRDPYIDFVIVPPRLETPHACGCSIPGGGVGTGGATAAALTLTLALARRRKRQK